MQIEFRAQGDALSRSEAPQRIARAARASCLWLCVVSCAVSCSDDVAPMPGSATGTEAGGMAPGATPSGGAVAGMSAGSGVAGRSPSSSSAGTRAVPTAGRDVAGSGDTAPSSGAGGTLTSAAGSGAGAAAHGGSGSGAAPASGTPLGPTQTLIPHASWNCGMPEGIPGPTGALLFDVEMQVGEIHDIGETQYGYRHQIDVTGGSVTGERVTADILEGGLDYQLVLSNGAVEVEQIIILRTSDQSLIYVRTCGAAPSAGGDVRIVMDFEAPNASAYAFLNMGKFVGSREFDPAAKTLKLHVFEAGAPDLANAVRVVEPDGVPDVTWDCKVAMGAQGDVVYTESVGIGGSLSVGESKRGNRNIIPITGGTTTGRIEGTVLSGGADFQIIANATFETIDARYTLETSDGELIIVRNCGPLGELVPVFEAKKDGNYGWINENTWLSSDPGLGIGAVNLTIYETR